ncbi:putative RING zinc finger domain superfamily protein isoform X1 [Zea mays]|uniref:RING/U-box superfamily protein n=2 Tax=Zea mays TaxID=4577 RepID=C0PFE1_MAIZE|nr:putative RING zinc finger domain superfamily protein [Zea mays]NP_001313352.1 putative RING zinc finger domain superfamily protein [Zea mays]XP_035821839.1 putative RING zinc finger domain superfamily protein isoform X1 [Zea mays]ACN33907.1 unknown [Zea mays]ACN34568.1 unknown [Zea mays]ACR38647.1 unknown [Zea mays]ONM31149.1 RING/U-box superfamily protein [Zea mays]ONM31151.1 RING/U-box superfamily protein [Zea mays]|eukprot:NP_001168244.1 putative RING zinc finger domain superfamily protein [Zea mays]
MGANCCIAAKERTQPCITPLEVSAYRNVRHSPSWSFRWDNRTHIEDIMEIPTLFSNHSSGSIRPDTKSGSIAPTEGFSNGNSLGTSPSNVSHGTKWHKSDKKMEASKVTMADPRADHPTASNSSLEAKLFRKSLDMSSVASDLKTSGSVPSTPPLVSRADPSSSRGHSQPTDSDSMKKARRSPGYQLYRQVSDSKIPSLRSLNEISSPEGRPSSSMLSVCSNDLSAAGSYAESSDGWSMRTFSEMVATSQRERWSLDSELLGSISSKVTRTSASNSTTLPPEQEVCKLCLKLLKERSTWNAQELAVVAVLLCGHVYHADCLDSITTEADKYDPPCPVCTHGEKCTVKLFGKLESKVKNKIPKNVAADINPDGNSNKHQKKGRREPRLGTSSSMKVPFSRPFLRRHFSIGSRPPRSVSETDSTRKKGFWARHWRE